MKRVSFFMLLTAALLLCMGCTTYATAYDPNMSHEMNLLMHTATCKGTSSFVDEGDVHRMVCSACEFTYTDSHIAFCDNPGKCEPCGAAVSTYEHTWLECTTDGKETHTYQCDDCGEVTSTEAHYAYCDRSNTVCAACGQTFLELSGEQIRHKAMYDTFVDQGANHLYTCRNCGASAPEEHYVVCTQPDLCYRCKATGVSAYGCTVHHLKESSGFCSACNTVTGGQTGPTPTPGDANEDGDVDIFDALAILQHATGWDIELSLSNGDVNADGACDIFDALLVLQYTVGWNVELL